MARTMRMRLRVAPVAKVIPLTDPDAPYAATIGDAPMFFTYSVESIEDIENHLLLLNVSNRTKL